MISQKSPFDSTTVSKIDRYCLKLTVSSSVLKGAPTLSTSDFTCLDDVIEIDGVLPYYSVKSLVGELLEVFFLAISESKILRFPKKKKKIPE